MRYLGRQLPPPQCRVINYELSRTISLSASAQKQPLSQIMSFNAFSEACSAQRSCLLGEAKTIL